MELARSITTATIIPSLYFPQTIENVYILYKTLNQLVQEKKLVFDQEISEYALGLYIGKLSDMRAKVYMVLNKIENEDAHIAKLQYMIFCENCLWSIMVSGKLNNFGTMYLARILEINSMNCINIIMRFMSIDKTLMKHYAFDLVLSKEEILLWVCHANIYNYSLLDNINFDNITHKISLKMLDAYRQHCIDNIKVEC